MMELSMAQLTHEIQGSPTMLFRPVGAPEVQSRLWAIVHDRRGLESDPNFEDIFFIPGNNVRDLSTAGKHKFDVLLPGSDTVTSVRVPDSLLWQYHGRPCQGRGANYRRLPEKVFAQVARNLTLGRMSILPHSLLKTKFDYEGPYDLLVSDLGGENQTQRFYPLAAALLR
jgi:hypothetical protein